MDLIEALYSMRRFAAADASRSARAAGEAEELLLHGLTREELMETLRGMFVRADTDGSGVLSRPEFIQALHESGLGLTRHEINALAAEADDNADGTISYEEFLPVAFSVLSEVVAMEFRARRLPLEEAALVAYLEERFGGRRLPRHEVRAVLAGSELGLSSVQLHAIMARAVEEEDGEGGAVIDTARFARDAAAIVLTMLEVQINADRAAEIRTRKLEGLLADEDRFQEALDGILRMVDPDNTGRAPIDAIAQAFAEPRDAGGLELADDQIRVLIDAGIDEATDSDGSVDVNRLALDAFRTLVALQNYSV